MPTYEYVCDACEHAFEKFQSMSDSPVRTCPECKKRKVRRLIGAGAGVIFKGSGFYETDYRSSSYKKGQEAEKKASSPEPKSDAKTKKSTGESSSKGSGGSCPGCPSGPSQS